jgi:WhiB family transcriptional regulator, redox-sensing transcriptional regulator
VQNELIAARAKRRPVDYYRTRAVGRLPEPDTAAWDWQLQAYCRGIDPSIFFPVRTLDAAGRKRAQWRSARSARSSRNAANMRSMPLNQYGIWGGTTPHERALLTPHTQLTGPSRPCETTADPRQNPSTAVAPVGPAHER